MPGGGGEKTETATSKKRENERKEGHIFQSKEIITVASLAVVFYSIRLLWPITYDSMVRSFHYAFKQDALLTILHPSDLNALFIRHLANILLAVLPLMLLCGLVTIGMTLYQTKLLVSFKSIRFKISKLSPLKGLKNIFSLKGLVELLKSIVKIILLGWMLWLVLKVEIPLLPRMMDMDPQEILSEVGRIILEIVNKSLIAFVCVAAADYFYQKWQYEKSIRMTKQEVKEEYKQQEGDPKIKGKIRDKQQRMAMQRMFQNLPSADVVIRNPTHFAVALRYDPKKDRAPLLIAKGMDSLALRIVTMAEKNGIVVTENKPLARGLYESVDLDREIPDQFYQAVAEVLAFVYSVKKKDLS